MRKYLLMLILAALALAFNLGCGGTVDDKAATQALQEAVNNYVQAINKGDNAARAAFFADDAMMMPNGWDVIKGKAAIDQVLMAGGDSLSYLIKDLEQVDLKASGDVGYTINRYSYSFNYKDKPPQWHKTKSINIWLRQPDGSWKLHADLWNSSTPREN